MAQNTECAVCLVDHEDELHAATLRVRSWFRDQVTLGFYEDAEELQEDIEAA